MAKVFAVDDYDETARRVRAAMAYANAKRKQIARALHVSEETVDRIKGTRKPPRVASDRELVTIAAECGLRPEWFYADFTRLAELTAPAPTRGDDPRAALHEIHDQLRLVLARIAAIEAEGLPPSDAERSTIRPSQGGPPE